MTAQKITIEPVTRIEGHAKITIRLKDDGTVEHAYLHINEFRGFEKFCEGRLVDDGHQSAQFNDRLQGHVIVRSRNEVADHFAVESAQIFAPQPFDHA